MPTDLRAAVAEAIVSHEWDGFPRSAHGDHNYYGACAICQGDIPRIAEVALSALAERSGDLPKRMAVGLREAIDYELTTGGESGLRELVASLDDPGSSVLVAAAMSVRDELVAHLAARAAAAEARVEYAEAGAQRSSERLAKVQQELAEAKARADKAEYDLEIRTHTAHSNARAHRVAYQESERQRERAEAAERKLMAKEAEVGGLNRDREGWRIRADKAEALLRDLVDADDCWFDHHGGCQAHGYLSLEPGERCPQAEAKELIAERETTTTPARETA